MTDRGRDTGGARSGSLATRSGSDADPAGLRGTDGRRLLAALAVLGMFALSGCLGQFGAGISEDALAEDAEYDWDSNATVSVSLEEGGILGGSTYRAVYAGNDTTIRLSTQGLTRSHAVDIRAVQFRYPNGTVVGHESIGVSQTARETTIRLPARGGQFAFSGDRRSQEVHIPAFDSGRYAVVLPPGHEVGDLLLSDVLPRGYETRNAGDRTRVVWSDVSGDQAVLVRHYSGLDWTIFYSLVTVLGAAGLVGYAYFTREIREIRRRREAHGLDVDVEEDDDRERPPPGMG